MGHLHRGEQGPLLVILRLAWFNWISPINPPVGALRTVPPAGASLGGRGERRGFTGKGVLDACHHIIRSNSMVPNLTTHGTIIYHLHSILHTYQSDSVTVVVSWYCTLCLGPQIYLNRLGML